MRRVIRTEPTPGGGRGLQPSVVERYGRVNPNLPTPEIEVTPQMGDTLTTLAHVHLGDYRRWKEIALRNDVRDPRLLALGVPLRITTAPVLKRTYAST